MGFAIIVMARIAVAFFPEIVALPAITGILFQQSIAAVMSKFVKRPKVLLDNAKSVNTN